MLTKDDYKQRIEAMRIECETRELDAVFIFANENEPANVRYFTNYRPVFETTAVVISRCGEAVLLIGPETEALALAHSVLQNYRMLQPFRETSDPEYPDIQLDTFTDIFSEMNNGLGIKKLGLIGTNLMTVQVYEKIQEALPDAVMTKEDYLLRKLRMIKSKKELDLIRRAAVIAGDGFKFALERIHPGMTELEAVAECLYGAYKYGAEGTGFQIWCVSGKATNQAIGIPTQRVIRRDEVVQISMGVQIEGYVSSFGRAFVFGNIQDDIKKMFEVNLASNAMTHELIRPGASAAEIAKKVHGFIRKEGFGDCLVYGPAHGIGMMECEYPFIETTSDFILSEGMTFAVDSYLSGLKYGMRFEDTVAVTSQGEEQFCDYRREIISL